MRLPGWKVTISLGAAMVLAAAGITAWHLRRSETAPC